MLPRFLCVLLVSGFLAGCFQTSNQSANEWASIAQLVKGINAEGLTCADAKAPDFPAAGTVAEKEVWGDLAAQAYRNYQALLASGVKCF